MARLSAEELAADFFTAAPKFRTKNRLTQIIREAEATARADERDNRQERVHEWCIAAFGSDQAASKEQRGLRLAEEAIEAAQAAGCDPTQLHALIDYIYARPVGDLLRELGGVGLTTLAFAAAAGLSADAAEQIEFERVLSKPLEHFTARNQTKNNAGFEARSLKDQADD